MQGGCAVRAGCFFCNLRARSALVCSIFNDVTQSGMVPQSEHTVQGGWIEGAIATPICHKVKAEGKG